MKKLLVAVCVSLVLAGALIAALCWHQQRQAARAQLIDADEAIRTLDQYSDQQYSGGPVMDLTQADLRARDKLTALDHAHLTEAENACALILDLALWDVETKVHTRPFVYQTALLKAEGAPNQKAADEAFAKVMAGWPKAVTEQNSCIDHLR